MAPLTVTQKLKSLGFRADFQAIREFQRAYALGPYLTVDGIAGPKTKAALDNALNKGKRLSPHFTAAELACKCGGRNPNCRRLLSHRWLLLGLEEYRTALGRPVPIVSGYRCSAHNRAVGGSSLSQHIPGRAVDIPPALSLAKVKGMKAFGGIGFNSATGLVVHVDVRHAITGSTSYPVTWRY